jgi:chromosome segregation ATPase
MWIRRLSVKHWRGLPDLTLDELSPHLNLISGPNESGKSRLVQALRFALFESSHGKGAHKKALASWAGGNGRPEVAVRFELDGQDWQLSKTFLGNSRDTTLRSAAETLTDEDAEQRLAQMLGVAPGGAREVKRDDLGIWSLLWVEQGDSRELPTREGGEAAETALQDRLTREIGEVAAGPLGQQVLERTRERYQRFYTLKTGAEREPLTAARAALADAAARYEEAIAQRQAVEDDAAALQRERDKEATLSDRLSAARARLDSLTTRHEKATAAKQQLQLSDERRRGAEAEHQRQQREAESANTLRARLVELDARMRELVEARGPLAARLDEASAGQTARRHEAEAADVVWDTARKELAAKKRSAKVAVLRAKGARLQQALDDAKVLDEQITALRDALAGLPKLSADDLRHLRTARQRVDETKATLQGVAAAVEIRAERNLIVDGRTLDAGDSLRVLVDDERDIRVDRVLSLHIRPGGGELARLRDAATDAYRKWESLAEELGVADVAAAEAALEARTARMAELDAVQREREHLLPEGRETADALLIQIQREVSDALPAVAIDPDAVEAAEVWLTEAEAARERARARRNEADRAFDEARHLLAVHDNDLEGAGKQRDSCAQEVLALNTEKAQVDALADAERVWREAVVARDAARATFDALGGSELDLELEQARQALGNIEDSVKQNRDLRIRLEARLEHVGSDGTHERVQALAADAERRRGELARLERDAAAARRLFHVLSDAYESAQQRLAQPVIERIRPYLADIFPGANVWLDERLRLQGLRGEQFDE